MNSADEPDVRTHRGIDRRLCGSPVTIEPGRAIVEWTAGSETGADDLGLVHGGFVFGLADHAAMLAINEPTVVLVSAETRFLRPVQVGESLQAEAVVGESAGRRHRVEVTVRRDSEIVMDGKLECVVTRVHVLERSS